MPMAPHDRTMRVHGMENEGDGHVSKSCKLEKRRIHKQKQRANFSAKIESYEDLEARTEHMESLVNTWLRIILMRIRIAL